MARCMLVNHQPRSSGLGASRGCHRGFHQDLRTETSSAIRGTFDCSWRHTARKEHQALAAWVECQAHPGTQFRVGRSIRIAATNPWPQPTVQRPWMAGSSPAMTKHNEFLICNCPGGDQAGERQRRPVRPLPQRGEELRRRDARRQRPESRHRQRRVPDAARAVGLGQDHDADDARRLRGADRAARSCSTASRSTTCRRTSATSAWCSRTTRCSRT